MIPDAWAVNGTVHMVSGTREVGLIDCSRDTLLVLEMLTARTKGTIVGGGIRDYDCLKL